MSEYNKSITVLRNKIHARNAEIDELIGKIGKELAGLQPDKVKDTPIFENFNKALALQQEIPAKRDVIHKIKKIDNHIQELNQEMSGLKSRVAEGEKVYKSIYENIGNTAYAAFKKNREQLQSYERIFKDLIKQDAKCEQFNKVNISENGEEKNILKQFVDAAKSMYRNQKHKFMLLRYPALYREAGKGILTTDFVEDASDNELDNAMKSLIDNEKVIKDLNDDIDKREEKKSGLEEELVSLDAQGRPNKKIQELEVDITGIKAKLRDQYMLMGNLFLEHNLSKSLANEQTKEYARAVSDLREANTRSESEIKRYETLIAIEKIDSSMSKTANKIEYIKNQVAKQEEEIKSLEKEKSQLEEQKKSLKKVLDKIPVDETEVDKIEGKPEKSE